VAIAGKIRMLLESLPAGSASPARGKYLATLRGYFDKSTGVIALEALSQMKFENGIPLAHYNRGKPCLWHDTHIAHASPRTHAQINVYLTLTP
jgi:hypothetical protein